MKNCLNCGEVIPNSVKIDGKTKIITSRKYCLTCSPFGMKNRKTLQNTGRKCLHCDNIAGGRRTVCTTCTIKKFRRQRKLLGIELLGGKCVRCGYCKCPSVLEFNHKDPSTKEFPISSRLVSLKKYKIELEKCELLCSNCHREHHYANEYCVQ